jgi:hypothetical protein
MKTQNQSDLEVKLLSLKDQVLAGLNAAKLILNPQLNGLTLTYEKRKGLDTQEGCKIIQLGLKARLNRLYSGNVEIHFETINEQSRIYQVTLEVATEANTIQAEQQLAYEALTEINKFIQSYIQLKKR